MMLPYTKNAAFHKCPSDPSPQFPWGAQLNSFPVSYITNYAVLTPWDFHPLPLATIQEPADTIAVGECARPGNWSGTHGYSGNQRAMPGQLFALVRIGHTRHNGGANYIFVDGHAKWYRIEATLVPKWLWGPATFPAQRRF
jgi:prepilin-type processing-associated H-X9-DG protein